MRILVLLFLCMLLGAAWGQVIPVPELPTPNAFDWYIKAGAQLADKEHTIEARKRMWERDAETMALKAEVLKANAQALGTLREGFAHRYQQPAIRHISTTMPYLAPYRTLTCLLVFEAQAKGEAGDWGGAMNSCLDAFRIGIDAPRGGVLISALVGIACQAIARIEMWSIFPHLTPAEARVAMARLQALHGTQTPISATMEEEKWIFQATLVDMKTHPEKYLESDDAEMETLAALLRMPGIIDELQRAHGVWIDALIAVTRQPYQKDRKYPAPKSKIDAVTDVLVEFQLAFINSPFHWARNETQTRLMLATLALRLYHSEHQAYPEKLSALPAALPGDPFAKETSFRYRRMKDSYLLYSVGPDGKDNHGAPVRDDDGAPATHHINPTSKGDIVVGVNCY